MPQSDYTNANVFMPEGYLTYSADLGSLVQGVSIEKKSEAISPELYFKYIKRKFGILETARFNARIKSLEKAFDKAVENKQDVLSQKFLMEVVKETRESAIYAKGFKMFVEKSDLDKFKRKIRGGHISDTQFKDFTRVIPEEILEKKKKSEGLFDGYVIYHYWNEEAEKKREKNQKISPDEKAKMRDPVLFGWIKESNRLYFIADWEDEFCDLTFEEITDYLGKSEEEVTLKRKVESLINQP